MTSVSIASDNADTTFATTGDTITVSFTSDEDLDATPIVTIAGQSATVAGGPTVWSATYTVAGTETEGVAAITIDGADLAGNALVQVTSVTDASYVIVDYSAPTLLAFTSSSPDATYGPTSVINVTATYDENVTGSITVSLNNTVTGIVLACPGGSTECSGSYTVGATGSGEDITTLDVSAITSESATDAAGNTQSTSSLPATTIATASSINVDVTVPTLQSFSTTTSAGTYGPTSVINVTATYDENVTGSITVSLNNTVTGIVLACPGGSTECSGSYTVGATGSGEDITTLDVSAITSESATDAYANEQTSSAIPGTNISTATLVNIDVTAPTLPTVTIESDNVNPGEAQQGNTITLAFTSNEAIVSLPTVVMNDSGANTLDSCGTVVDVSAGARTGWELDCVVQITDANGVVTFTIDFADDAGNDGTQVDTPTDASSVEIKLYGGGGGGGSGAGGGTVIEKNEDTVEEEDNEVIEEDSAEEKEIIEDSPENDEEKEIIEDSPSDNDSDDDQVACEGRYACERDDDANDFMSYQKHLACAGVLTQRSSCTDANCTSNTTRKEVAGIAIKLGNHKPLSLAKYTGHFQDVNASSADWVRSAVETGFGLGLFSSEKTRFRPDDSITRAESYAILMKSVCMPIPQISSDWQLNVHAAAQANGLTSRTFGSFGANDAILRQEIFVIGSRLLDYMNQTGGCYAKPMCSN